MTQLALQDLLPVDVEKPDISFVMEWPPSLNSSYDIVTIPPKVLDMKQAQKDHGWTGDFYNWLRRHTRTRSQPNSKANVYREVAAWQVNQQIRTLQFGSSRLAIWMTMHPPRNGIWDLDNYKKHPWDALKMSRLIDDDCQFDASLVTRGDKVEGGSVEVKIWRM